MSEHTPGPYNIGIPGGPAGPFWTVLNQQGTIVALQVTTEANARLIAAAPDLLAACYAALVPLEHAIDGQAMEGELERAASDIRAAIAKAEGTN